MSKTAALLDVTLGLDIGSTYTKATICAGRRRVLGSYRARSPQVDDPSNIVDACQWWERIIRVTRGLMTTLSHSVRVTGICVSAITPTLVVFEENRSACGLMYSCMSTPESSGSVNSSVELTEAKCRFLMKLATSRFYSNPLMTDLVGFINWRMTEVLSINTIALVEAGLTNGEKDCEMFSANGQHPQLVAPLNQIGTLTNRAASELGLVQGTPVYGGCSDTLSSVIGAGLSRRGDKMLYLGTYGSLMLLESDVSPLLRQPVLNREPFNWILSVPGMGPLVEVLAEEWFSKGANSAKIQLLEAEARRSPVGADGTLFLLPRWKGGMTTIGTHRIVLGTGSRSDELSRRSRSLLEGLGYAVHLVDSSREKVWAAGGGARSNTWLLILASVLRRELVTADGAWDAVGSAMIAGHQLWGLPEADTTASVFGRSSSSEVQQIELNLEKLRQIYAQQGWL